MSSCYPTIRPTITLKVTTSLCAKIKFQHDPLFHFRAYLDSRGRLFPLAAPLWLTENRQVPSQAHSFFTRRLCLFFDNSVGGQLMRASGATSLAEHGVPPSIIQPLGRWSSQAFLIYIRKSPALIQAMLYSDRNTSTVSNATAPL